MDFDPTDMLPENPSAPECTSVLVRPGGNKVCHEALQRLGLMLFDDRPFILRRCNPHTDFSYIL
ncbi:hypothetical protein CCR75_006762 [Bremia lactucae]|uniref:Uncharacterized protein n=1 Tax=Bremia lactucae TaxID=4779 RepID=A0A976FFH6_BRELC|nr:hypothetical protein CCR75_006762 [Bremia lactucae]